MNHATDPQKEKTIFGHPVGLWFLSFTEAWERFSYYGMLTLLALYMTKQLLLAPHVDRVIGFGPFHSLVEGIYAHGGAMTPIALATAVVGLYSSLVYVTPILGGILADRVIGRTWAVTIGAVLMACGHFLMAFDQSFLMALLCLVLGVGCFKGNIATQVGDLYKPGDNRRADAFQAYMLGIQIAVIISPLVCGTLGEVYGWHWGFGAAGVGMLVGLLIYLSGRKWLPPEPMVERSGHKEHPSVAPTEWRAIFVLVAILPILALAAVGNQQIFAAYILWGDANYHLTFLGQTMPVTWLISFDSIVSTVTMAGSVMFWRWWKTRHTEPNEITKLTIGTIIAATAPLALAFASIHAPGQKVGLEWALAFHTLNDIGFANIFPVGLALYSRAAPKAIGGTIIAVYYLHMVACNFLVGWLGGLLEKMSGFSFWLLHTGIIGVAALALLAVRGLAGRLLTPTADA
jgi:POT family proton-dependent oligopeptide transporter